MKSVKLEGLYRLGNRQYRFALHASIVYCSIQNAPLLDNDHQYILNIEYTTPQIIYDRYLIRLGKYNVDSKCQLEYDIFPIINCPEDIGLIEKIKRDIEFYFLRNKKFIEGDVITDEGGWCTACSVIVVSKKD